MESLVENCLYADVVHLNNHNVSTLTSEELSFSPFLAKLFLQENSSLTMLPPSFFQHMPVLQVLDLSHTSIQSVPPSISKLCSLEEFILRECSLLMDLPPEIGALKNLKLFDLEGTELMYLPKEIGKLETLERLRVSLSAYADDYKDSYGIKHIIPRTTILKLTKLKELSISVSPEAEWWEVELLEAIMGDLCLLPDLKTLKLYLPTAKALQQFLRLERCNVPIYSRLWNYRFMTGHCEELPLSVQLDTEESFLKLERCVKYMNGEGYTDEIMELIRDARALYLRRHWSIKNLSMFDIRKLKYCLLMECNEMQTLVDQEDFYRHKDKSTSLSEDEILGSLQYLSLHFSKKLQRISKGPIGRSSLSCLRILALHTCPELTSIFTESLLDNLQSLTEVIVEDCPKVTCLVSLDEGATWRNGPFLPNLKRILLLDLPELVSVSGGVCIAPQLDTLLVFNCMKLDYLSDMEIPRDTREIKGEIEWWNALKYGKLTWESVFVQLKRDGSLMDQLAEETNSLQHFLELKMVPSFPGEVNQNSSRGIKEDREHVDELQIDHVVDLSNETRKLSNQEPSDDGYIWRKHIQNKSIDSSFPRKHGDFRIIKPKHKREVIKRIEVKKVPDDGYIWEKYGPKDTFGVKYPRAFYRCNFSRTHVCPALKQVQKRSTEDPFSFEVVYMGMHTCPTILGSFLQVNENSSKDTKEVREHVDQLQIVHNVDLSNATQKMLTQKILNCYNGTQSQYAETAFRMWEPPPSLMSGKTDNADTNFIFKVPNYKLASTKKKSRSADIAKWIQQVKGAPHDVRKCLRNESLSSKYSRSISIITSRHEVKVNKGIEVEKALDDGYIWRKYGEKPVNGSKYSRAYYRCSKQGCCAKKRVERSTEDPSVHVVSYNGKHTCNTVLSKNCSLIATESACTTLRTRNSSTTTESASVNTDSHVEVSKRPQLLDSNKTKSILARDAKGTQRLKVRPRDSSTTTESDSVITDSHFELAQRPQMLESNKKKSISTRNATWTQQLKVCPDTGFDVPPGDGYVWRKDDQHDILGSKSSMHSVTSDATCESESASSILKSSESSVTIESELRNLKNSGSSTTAESSSTITVNSLGLDYTKKMNGSAIIQRWKQQTEEIQSPSLKLQLPSSYEPNQMIVSEVAENGSMNLSVSTKTPQNAKLCPLPVVKVRKEKIGDKITELQQLVSPFGKADTASVLSETCGYIKFLHEQVNVLMTPNIKQETPLEPQQQAPKQDLRGQGLCLVPVASTFPLTNQTTTNFSSPIFGELIDGQHAYKAK